MLAEWGEAMTHLSKDCRQAKQLRNCQGPSPELYQSESVRVEKNLSKIGGKTPRTLVSKKLPSFSEPL